VITENEYLKLCSEKPDLFGALPDRILSAKRIEELRQIPRVAVGEIPGYGRLEPVLESLSVQRPDAFLPTIAYTGTEYGRWENLKHICVSLKKSVEKKLHIYCTEPVILGSPRFWWALNGLYLPQLYERFGLLGTCYGCRLYAFALRIPLCRTIEAHMFIPSVQGQHEGCATGGCQALRKYGGIFMAGFGIEVVYNDSDKADMGQAVYKKSTKREEKEKLSCVLAPRIKINNAAKSDEYQNTKSFFESYAIPAVARIISKKLTGASVDYSQEIDDIVLPLLKNKK